jgi:hypothetical protein
MLALVTDRFFSQANASYIIFRVITTKSDSSSKWIDHHDGIDLRLYPYNSKEEPNILATPETEYDI